MSLSIKKCLAWFCATLLLVVCAGMYLYLTNRVDYLVVNRHLAIEVNGVAVRGEVLEGRASAVVTRRDVRKGHSYRLWFAGDVDTTGNAGFVVDCRNWIAPKLPVLLETRSYSPCQAEDGSNSLGWPLLAKNGSEQFVTGEGEVIAIRRR